MKVHFTAPAARQLASILDYIAERHPSGARSVQTRIKVFLDIIAEYPDAGSETAKPGLRRIVIDRYPYVIFYRVKANRVIVSAVRHTSRRPRS